MADFIGERECTTHHACDRIMHERDRLERERDMLREKWDEAAAERDHLRQQRDQLLEAVRAHWRAKYASRDYHSTPVKVEDGALYDVSVAVRAAIRATQSADQVKEEGK